VNPPEGESYWQVRFSVCAPLPMWGEVCGFCCVTVLFKRDISFILLFHYLAYMRDSEIHMHL
jgi:hypothetical protein